jgi:hypothetical protein
VEELLLLVFDVVLELVVQVVLEILAELGLSALQAALDRPRRSLPLAAMGLFLVGAGLGGLSLLVWPDRIFEPGPVPGLSLVLSPVCAGAAMHAWGAYRRSRGHAVSDLATFTGGAAFALGTALVRFLWAH